MKNILLILLLVYSGHCFGQKDKDKNEPKELGFVFVNGKYIEPPYKVKKKNMSIYINGYEVYTIEEEKDPFAQFNRRLPTPPCLDNTTNIDYTFNDCIEPVYGIPYFDAMKFYYLKHYKYEEAIDSLEAYMRTFPNIKSITKQGSFWAIETHIGENRHYPIMLKSQSLKWGPGGTGPTSKAKKEEVLDYRYDSFESDLFAEGMIIMILPENNNNRYINFHYTEEFIPIYERMINSNYSDQQIRDSLKTIIYDDNCINIIIKNRTSSTPLKERVKTLDYEKSKSKKKIFNQNTTGGNIINNNQRNLIKSTTAYSPASKLIYGWCPNMWQTGFTEFITVELSKVFLYTQEQGYYLDLPYNAFTDNTPNDNNIGSCTYTNFLEMTNAGILNFSGHGNEDHVLAAISSDYNSLSQWIQAGIIVDFVDRQQIGWDLNTPCYGAYVFSEWFQTHWQNALINSNAIVIMSSCYGGVNVPNSIINNVGGGVAFGYSELTETSGILLNNERLFRRMNGVVGQNGAFREAALAYADMPYHDYGFVIKSNKNITLCPAPVLGNFANPAPGSTVPLSGHATFEIDTWCDASQTNPLTITCSHCTISNLDWDNPQNGLSNKISFDWNATANDYIEVHVEHDKIRSAPFINNGYHFLDYDRVRPNDQDGDYIYTVNVNIPTEEPVANFSFTVNQNHVTFVNESQNNPTSFLWNFGDGSTSTMASPPTHTYSAVGTYNVTLTATNTFGSDDHSAPVTIEIIPQTITISGKVYNGSTEIIGANVTCCDYASDVTDANGYSLDVDAPFSGQINATATNFLPGSIIISSSNPLINNTDDLDIYLYTDNFYITASAYVANCYTNVDFHAHNVPSDYGYYFIWSSGDNFGTYTDGNGPRTDSQYSTYFNYSEDGVYTVTFTVYNSAGDDYITRYCTVTINESSPPTQFIPQIYIPCYVAEVNEPVTFYDYSEHTYALAELWRWNFDFYNPPSPQSNYFRKDTGNFVNQSYLSVSVPYLTQGKKNIKLQTYGLHDVGTGAVNIEYDGITWYESFSAWAGLYVVDCDLIAQPIPLMGGNFIFSNSVFNEESSHPLCYAGNFEFDGRMNNTLSMYDWTLSACNEIIINGNTEFIADGSHELILESGVIPNCPSYVSTKNFFISPVAEDTIVENHISENSISIHPNPCNDFLNLNVSIYEKKDLHVYIYDVIGLAVSAFKYTDIDSGSYTFTVNTSKLKPGIYFLKCNINESTFKFVKSY